MALSTNPNVVSRQLRAQGFARSFAISAQVRDLPRVSQGFETHSQNGKTLVYYTLGTDRHMLASDTRRAEIAQNITAMEKALSRHYTVIMFEPTEGESYTLTILPKD
jgi:hypothetical protein